MKKLRLIVIYVVIFNLFLQLTGYNYIRANNSLPSPLYYGNFENMSENSQPESLWTSTSNVLVSTDNEQGKVLKINDNSSSSYYAKIPFQTISDYLSISFKFKFDFVTSSNSYLYFSLYDGYTETIRLRLYNTGTTVRLENQASSNTTISASVAPSIWHELKCVINISKKEMYVYLDNNKNGVSVANFYNILTQVNELRFATHSSTQATLLVDDIYIYNDNLLQLSPVWLDKTINIVDISPKKVTISWEIPWDFIGIYKYNVHLIDNANVEVISEVYDSNETTISNLLPNHQYTIKIEAVNFQKLQTNDGPQIIFNTPELFDNMPPEWSQASVVISNYTENSVIFTWNYASDESGISKYHIFINDEEIASVDSTVCSYTYNSLTPNTNYTIRIEAEDIFGHVSTNGPTATFKTRNDVTPPYWDKSVVNTSIDKYGVKLIWSGANDNVSVAYYVVYENDSKILETPNNSCIIQGLKIGNTYKFKVEAVDSSLNQSNNGPSVDVLYIDDVAPYWLQNSKLLLSDLTPTSVKVKWNQALDNFDIVEYEVYLNDEIYRCDIKSGKHNVLGEVYMCDINNLTPNTNYKIEIKAVDSSGNYSVDNLIKTFITPGKNKNTVPQVSKIIYEDNLGFLQYIPYNEQGDIIPDFSKVGYKAGENDIPANIPVVAVIYPDDDQIDDTVRLQTAIDNVANLPLDNVSGFRGAILLKRGKYYLNNSLIINKSGIVIYGEGQDEDGTVLYATKNQQYDLITIKGNGKLTEIPGTRVKIKDKYVPVGATSFEVENASLFKVGDNIVVFRPATDKWIHDIGMDNIPTDKNPTVVQWKASDYNMEFERTITKIEGNRITIDVPIVNSIDSNYAVGEIYKYSFDGRINNIGIENLRLESYFDNSKYDQSINEYIDELHGWKAISIDVAEDCWVKNVTSKYFAYSCVSMGDYSRRITVDACSNLDPVSTLAGGLRYSFDVNGQQILVKNCYSRGGRHDFVLGSKTLGPNVFYNCIAENANNVSEPHHRWSAGVLYDNVTVNGKQGYLEVINRNDSGTGHGWTGAQVVFWNCSAPIIVAMKPPTAQNFIFGVKNIINGDEAENAIDYAVSQVNSMARTNYKYSGIPVLGDGYIESPNAPMKIQSLYERQVQDRIMRKTAKDFIDFSIKVKDKLINGEISNSKITLRVPEDINLENVIAFFKTTGESVYIDNTKQISGITVNNFTKPVEYTIYAQDGSTKKYSLNVILYKNQNVQDISDNQSNYQTTNEIENNHRNQKFDSDRNITLKKAENNISMDFEKTNDSKFIVHVKTNYAINDLVLNLDSNQLKNINDKIRNSNTSELNISLDNKLSDNIEVNIPFKYLLEDTNIKMLSLTVNNNIISIPAKSLKAYEKVNDQSILKIKTGESVYVKQNDFPMKINIRNRPVINVEIIDNHSKKQLDIVSEEITLSIPYRPNLDELKKTHNISVLLIDNNGSMTFLPNSYFDKKRMLVVCSSKKLGTFVVSYNNQTFEDIKDLNWANIQIETLASRGIVTSKNELMFSPNDFIKRSEFVSMIVKAFNFEAKFYSNFADVDKTSLYYNDIGIAKTLGIINGEDGNYFSPDKPIKREEMVVILARALEIVNKVPKTNLVQLDYKKEYSDFNQISPYALKYFDELLNMNLLKGNNKKLKPKSNSTRAEAAVLVYRALFN